MSIVSWMELPASNAILNLISTQGDCNANAIKSLQIKMVYCLVTHDAMITNDGLVAWALFVMKFQIHFLADTCKTHFRFSLSLLLEL